jgi:hypothetical protein
MPNAIEGLDSTLKALRKLSPELYKQMNREIRPALKSITADAKQELPSRIVGLSNWTNPTHEAKSRTSRAKAFPSYEITAAKRGVTYSTAPRRLNTRGWVALYSIWNLAASGAIIDTAGRKSGRDGNSSSKSNNPNASAHFIQAVENAVGGFYRVGTGARSVGRVIYKAVNQDDGKAKQAIIDAANKATAELARTI